MAEIKTNALMPKGAENGLDAIAAALVQEATGNQPSHLRAALVILDAKRATVDSDSGTWQVTVRFRRVEVLLPADLPEAEKFIRRALEARSGQDVLPLDLETELEQAFQEMVIDPDNPGADPDDAAPGADDGQDGAA